MYQIEFIEEPFCKVNGQNVYPGDRKTVSKEERDAYVSQMGWAKCLATGETGERKPGAQELNINSVGQESA